MPNNRQKVLKSLERTFMKGQILFREGEETRDFFILLDGEVEIRKNDRAIAVLRNPDTYIGEMSTLLGTPRTATVVANKDTRVIRVPEEKVTDFFAHSPALGLKLAKVLAARLQEMNVKYERMLVELVPDEKEAVPMFEKLTANTCHRNFLEFYCTRVGQTVSIKDIVTGLEIPAGEINRVFLSFGMAGLIDILDRNVTLKEAPNKALRQMILNWSR